MNGAANSLLWLGRVHPLLVHLPIGGLVLLVFLELVARLTRFKELAQNRQWVLAFICATTAACVATGLMLAKSGGYDQQLVKCHQMAALGLLAVCGTTLLWARLQFVQAYRLTLAVALALLVVAGHFGGSLSHGRGFLFGARPASAGGPAGKTAPFAASPGSAALAQPVFTAVVEPILRQRCVSCHGPEKHKADLRLDTLAALLKGGQNGPVIKARDAKDSSLLQRILIPLEQDGHMPPQGETQMTAQEIALIEWWLNAGAPGQKSLGDLKPDPRIWQLLEIVSKPAGAPN